MRIVCPNCSAAYDVPEALFAGNFRTVRCARCSQEWAPQDQAAPAPVEQAQPVVAEAPRPEPATAEPTSIAAPPAPPASVIRPAPLTSLALPRTRTPLVPRQESPGARVALVGWAATLLLLIAGGAAAYHWREPIESAWPPIERAYAAIGLD